MLRLAFDFIITWRETRTRPNAYTISVKRATPGGIIKMLCDYERKEGDPCIL